MILSEFTELLFALVVGCGLSMVFFGGLWLTLNKLPDTHSPALLVIGSLIIRLSITLIGFYLVMNGSLMRLLACLAGFILMRQLLIRQLGSPPAPAKQA